MVNLAAAIKLFVTNEIDYDIGKEIDRGDWDGVTWDTLAEEFKNYLTTSGE